MLRCASWGLILLTRSALTWFVLAVCCAFYFAALFLYHFMVFRVNKNLPPDDRIPHSLTFGQRDRLRAEYKALSPKHRLSDDCALCPQSDCARCCVRRDSHLGGRDGEVAPTVFRVPVNAVTGKVDSGQNHLSGYSTYQDPTKLG